MGLTRKGVDESERDTVVRQQTAAPSIANVPQKRIVAPDGSCVWLEPQGIVPTVEITSMIFVSFLSRSNSSLDPQRLPWENFKTQKSPDGKSEDFVGRRVLAGS